MRYLELSKEAKKTAVNDYCGLMEIEVNEYVEKWIKTFKADVFLENGLLMHRKR